MTRFTFVTAFVGLLGFASPSIAQPVEATRKPSPSCTGKNLVDEAQRSNPAAYKAILDKASTTPNAEGLLWRIEKPGLAPSYLFGTLHVTDDRAIEIARSMDKYLSEVRTVALEIGEDPTSPAYLAAIRAKQAQSTLASRTGLASLIEFANDRERVIDFLKGLGVEPATALRMPPWYALIQAQTPVCEKERRKGNFPVVDSAIRSIGTRFGAEIVGLERAGEPFEAFLSIDPKLAAHAIVALARKDDFIQNIFVTNVELYVGQRIGEIMIASDLLIDLSPEDAALNRAWRKNLLDNRNLIMLEGAKPLIDAGPVFIAVGAAHLVGTHGLVELFRQSGYVVARVQ